MAVQICLGFEIGKILGVSTLDESRILTIYELHKIASFLRDDIGFEFTDVEKHINSTLSDILGLVCRNLNPDSFPEGSKCQECMEELEFILSKSLNNNKNCLPATCA